VSNESNNGFGEILSWSALAHHIGPVLEECRKEDVQLGLMIVELCNLRQINNRFGISAGDRTLQRLVETMEQAKRGRDVVIRVGTTHIVLALPGIRGEGQAILAVTKLLRQFWSNPPEEELPEPELHIGIAMFPDHAQEIEALILHADQALHLAILEKQLYRVFAVGDDSSEQAEWDLERELKRALEEDELELVYQPKIDLVTGGLVGLEAFARWRHPERGLIGARSFAGKIEGTGLLHRFNWWALKTALRQVSERPGPWNRLPVAVNVSLKMLEDTEFPGMLEDTLGLWGVTADRVTLELIESEYSLDLDRILASLEKLEKLGVHLAVDNFGEGRDALALVRLLTIDQIDQIKIPQSLTCRLESNQRGDRIVQTIIDLAHRMNIAVVAGGIENHEAMQVLAGLGCDYGQGYYIAQPMDHSELSDWLARRG